MALFARRERPEAAAYDTTAESAGGRWASNSKLSPTEAVDRAAKDVTDLFRTAARVPNFFEAVSAKGVTGAQAIETVQTVLSRAPSAEHTGTQTNTMSQNDAPVKSQTPRPS